MSQVQDDCIFCKIANGEIPSATVYEDEDFRVILDISPAAKGHALILPKKHFANAYEIEESYAAKVFPLEARIAKAMKKVFGCDGVNILQNNEEAAGQTVYHFHVHIIPRYADDGIDMTWNTLTTQPEEQEEIAKKLRMELD